MIEMNVLNRRYPCKTKDLLWYSSRANEIRTAIVRRISAVDLAFLQFFAEQSSELR